MALVSHADPKSDFAEGIKQYNNGDVIGSMAFLKRAADAGDGDAQAFYAFVLGAAEMEEDALVYYRKSTAQNNLDGMHGLAAMMAAGRGGLKPDLPGARKLYEQAAALGHEPSVQVIVAAYMQGGLGMTEEERNSPAALSAIKKAAEGGHLKSALWMVKVYQEGMYGVAPDKGEAKKWSELANNIAGKKVDEKKKRRR